MENKWSNLPTDLFCRIAGSMPTPIDLLQLGAVCRSWRSAALQEKLHNFLRPSPIPWLMLAEEPDCNQRRFFHPTTGKALEVYLPEACERNCCSSTDGWLVTMGEDLKIHLLNPLSRDQLLLPPYNTFKDNDEDSVDGLISFTDRQERDRFMRKVVLSCRPGSDGGRDCLVLANVDLDGYTRLFFARPGDEAWMLIDSPRTNPAEDMIYFKNKFYIIGCTGEVMILDHDVGEKDEEVIKLTATISPESPCDTRNWNHYLMDVGGELVAIARRVCYASQSEYYSETESEFESERDDESESDPEPDHDPSFDEGAYRTRGFKLFKLGSYTSYSEWTEINDLGDRCLFIGRSTSICLSPVPAGCKKNSIYFTDDFREGYIGGNREGGGDMGVFSLDDGRITPHYEGESLSFFSPPLWVTLNSSLMCSPPLWSM